MFRRAYCMRQPPLILPLPARALPSLRQLAEKRGKTGDQLAPSESETGGGAGALLGINNLPGRLYLPSLIIPFFSRSCYTGNI